MERRTFLKIAAAATGSAILTACGVGRRLPESTSVPDKVGGVWGKLPSGTITNPNMDIEVYAYKAQSGDPEVSYVNITGYWPGAKSPDPDNPNAWPILCKLDKPKEGTNEYDCKINLDDLGVPPGGFTLSFDVYNTKGDENLAPNGTKEFNYKPQ